MASSTHSISANFRDRIIKAASLRLSDDAISSSTNYVDLVVGSGTPSGRYGRDTTALLVYFNEDATNMEEVLYILLPSASTWETWDADVSLPDSGVLSFGDDDDVTFTHDGATGVEVAGVLEWQDDQALTLGDDADGSITFTSATPALDVTVDSADLALATTTSGDVVISAGGAGAVDIDAGGVLFMDGAGGAALTSATNDLTLAATANSVVINAGEAAADAIDLNATAGGVDIDAAGAVAIDAVGNSNLTTDSGNLTLQSTTTGNVVVDAVAQAVVKSSMAAPNAIRINANDVAGGIDIDAGSSGIAVDTTGAATIQPEGILTLSTGDITGNASKGVTSLAGLVSGDRNLTDALGSPNTGDVVVQSGESVVDNGAGAATGGDSGDLTVRTGDTNCDDAAGTGGATGAASFGSGDADSNAGTSGNSGDVTLSTGFSDDADSGSVLIEAGSAANNAGGVILRPGAGGGKSGTVLVQDPDDNTMELEFDASGISSGNTRTLTMADADIDLETGVPRVINWPLSYSDFTASAQSETINVGVTLPADAIVTGAFVELSTEFNSAGGGASPTQADIEVGTSGDPNRFMVSTDVWQAAGVGSKLVTPGVSFDGTESVAYATNAQCTLTMTVGGGETVDLFNAGDLTVFVYYVVPTPV